MALTVYGASDDLIEIEGDISEEFDADRGETGSLLVLSCGVVSPGPLHRSGGVADRPGSRCRPRRHRQVLRGRRGQLLGPRHDRRARSVGRVRQPFRGQRVTTDGGDHGESGAPIPMRLPCPSCGALHLDVGEFATKPHHTHACQECGMVWRPAVVATVGVAFLPGFKNEHPSCWYEAEAPIVSVFSGVPLKMDQPHHGDRSTWINVTPVAIATTVLAALREAGWRMVKPCGPVDFDAHV